jgi:Lrp/AsnC family leucine-responsive transcriptional regulator
LDELDKKILGVLEQQARISMKNLGQIVGLSSPAVIERVRRLEDKGIIENYQAVINYEKIEKLIIAFINVNVLSINFKQFVHFVQDRKEIFECHHVIGGNCFILKVRVATMEQLSILIEDIKKYGNTNTSVVLSSPLKQRAMFS